MKTFGPLMLAFLIGAASTDGGDCTLMLYDNHVRKHNEKANAEIEPLVHRLDGAAKTKVQSLALQFLESSNFNSVHDRDILKVTTQKVHAAYRKAAAGRYLVLSFDTPRRVKTIHCEVDVLEVVIGLNGPDYANSLFTIDGEGRVVSHEKYSGTLGVELLQAVKDLFPNG